MSTTVLDLIEKILIEANVISAGEPVDGDDAALTLFHLNNILDDANIDRSKIHRIAIDTYTLTPGLQPHTIGVDPSGTLTATFAAARPSKIIRAFLVFGSGSTASRWPIHVWTNQEWSVVSQQGLTDNLPYGGVYPDYASPLCGLYFWPIPTSAATYEQHSYQQFSEFTGLTDILTFPPGYRSFLFYDGTIRICAAFGTQPKATTVAGAAKAALALQTINSVPLQMSCDPQLANSGASNYNIFTDQ